jgi:Secretion system C-terminal sorting domain
VESTILNRSDTINNRLPDPPKPVESLVIYPNPFNDNLVLNYSGRETGQGKIILYNSEMRLIATFPFVKTSSTMSKTLVVPGLTNGVYFVQFNIGKTKIMKLQLKM